MKYFIATKKTSMLLIYTVSIGIFFSGCGRKPVDKNEDTRVIAKINNYELTVSDFKGEASSLLARKYLSKDEVLNEIITKKVLLQEAQRENFDKDKAFMKEIERYWEQTLLKLLLKKKSQELARQMNEENAEKAFDEWIADLKNKASVKINKQLLDSVEIKRN